MQRISFHNVTLDCGTKAEATQQLLGLAQEKQFSQVVTVNPEYIVLAQKQRELQDVSRAAALTLVDGFGLAWALRRYNAHRYAGADAVLDVLTYATRENLRVGFLLSPKGLSRSFDVLQAIRQRFPNVQAEAWESEPTNVDLRAVNAVDILFVTYGQPLQDTWIYTHRAQLNHVRIAMGVGGSVDFLTGKRRRAPRTMRHLGLEWLWRALTQPKRLPRIFRATFGFWYTLLTT